MSELTLSGKIKIAFLMDTKNNQPVGCYLIWLNVGVDTKKKRVITYKKQNPTLSLATGVQGFNYKELFIHVQR